MFRNRQSSQRPPDELFERFKQSFPDVRSTTGGECKLPNTVTCGLQDSTLNQPRFGHDHEDLDPTPRAPGEPFRFTPSLLDPNSAAFAAFSSQPPGFYTPTPGGANTAYSNPTNELPTPTVGVSIGAPLTLSNGTSMVPPPPTTGFSPQTIQPHQFHNFHPFAQPLPQFVEPTYDPSNCMSGPGSPMDLGGDIEVEVQDGCSMGSLYARPYEHEQTPPLAEKFHVTLNAPTAMIKHPDEIPVTYLNKGQAYSILIVDALPPPPSATARYRTYIRISFHDEGQRQKPAACWQLWKEGRGTNEAHQRGGKLQAVEYVEPSLSEEEEKKRATLELESASFDGFAVVWSPMLGGASETSVSVRFNFLSTDFSHSKGVKGIPVRLCAKTEVLSSGPPSSTPEQPEICFCKVKLFRDHGAERKLANDVLHVKKTIEKLRQQLQQTEGTGTKLFGKKKKDDDALKSGKPGKAQKHKRSWSMSSASSVNGKSQEEEINEKLVSLQDMFTSTRPVSILYLRGGELDDPDLHPVQLPGENPDNTWARRRSSVATTASFVSPTPSSVSLASSQHENGFPSERRDWVERGFQSLQPALAGTNGSDVPVRIKTQNGTGPLSGWIEAIGVDSTYNPPTERPPRASMCIYILPILPGSANGSQFYRAVYLAKRTQACLTAAIAAKCGIEPVDILRTTIVNNRGLTILVDDDLVKEMNEGQDMKVQVAEVEEDPTGVWSTESASTNDVNGVNQVNGSNGELKSENSGAHGYELKLLL